MHILLTNDDGIYAEGIKILRRQLEGNGYRISVVAPHTEKSAIGHGITVHNPIRVDKVKFRNSTTPGWAVTGTPADCVKLAIEVLLDSPPDIIISGINHGANLGTDVLYSGTVSAAMEGFINGIPSIAVSLTSYENPSFKHAAIAIHKLLTCIKENLTSQFMLNINIPPISFEKLKGIQVTKLSVRKYINCIEVRKDPRGNEYYWLAGEPVDKNFTAGTDAFAVEEGYISITPLHFDLTAEDAIPWLANIDWKC